MIVRKRFLNEFLEETSMSKGLLALVPAIALIVGILYYTGFFNSADITRTRQGYTDYTCPSYVATEFTVLFSNSGSANTNLCVYASSQDVNFTKSSDCIYLPKDSKSVSFTLRVADIPYLRNERNVTIRYTWTFKKSGFNGNQTYALSCYYRQPQGDNVLRFLSES